jgi:hypothetical protein
MTGITSLPTELIQAIAAGTSWCSRVALAHTCRRFSRQLKPVKASGILPKEIWLEIHRLCFDFKGRRAIETLFLDGERIPLRVPKSIAKLDRIGPDVEITHDSLDGWVEVLEYTVHFPLFDYDWELRKETCFEKVWIEGDDEDQHEQEYHQYTISVHWNEFTIGYEYQDDDWNNRHWCPTHERCRCPVCFPWRQ